MTVQGRLEKALREYLATLNDGGMVDLSIEAIAKLASVSRATAYRYFGDRDGLLFRATVILTQQHADATIELIRALPTAGSKIEEVLAYVVRVVSRGHRDRKLQILLSSPQTPAIDEALHEISVAIYEGILPQGRANGELRDDLTDDETVRWLRGQQGLLVAMSLSESDAREWIRKFVLPALRPQHNHLVDSAEVRQTLDVIERRVNAVGKAIVIARSTLK